MSHVHNHEEYQNYNDFAWRRHAPRARGLTQSIYSWQDPGWSFLFAIGASAPFILAALLSPALLSFVPTMDMLAPIAEARSVRGGQAALIEQDAPFYLLILMAADVFVDAPGRIHLVAKAICAILIAYPMAYLTASRFPVLLSVLLTSGLAAFVVSPFAGPAEFGFALLMVCAVCFVTGSADQSGARARFEGLLAGVLLFWLWVLNPVFSLTAFLFLSACPFLTGRTGLMR